ncbi:MAG: acyl-CoA reductase [Chitinophagales bacterium]|nr:acyl-CoA reductase [Chitinophagales bacterium]
MDKAIEKRLDNLAALGKSLKTSERFKETIQRAEVKNPWFTKGFVKTAVNAIADEMLEKTKLQDWLNAYPLHEVNKTIGLIFAGNVPLVGFHDFLCCYVAGCRIKIKLSSKDDDLFPAILSLLSEIDSELNERVEIVDTLKNFDAVIATGSDNTNRYFEYYFRDYPKILRANRNSVAILKGNESKEDLEKLADDIFLYFGFGCRNVSKLYVPVGYNFETLFPAFQAYAWLHQHTKYMNNYDYNRTILLMNKTPHFADDKVMLVEDARIASPIATLHYEYWHDENILASKLKQNADKIQCIVSGNPGKWEGASEAVFGNAQHPALNDYADGVDTMTFLLGL